MKKIKILGAALMMMAATATTMNAADVTRDAHGTIREKPAEADGAEGTPQP